MNLREYIKKAYNLNEDEYTLTERKEQSECICGKKYHWIDMHYDKKLRNPHGKLNGKVKHMKRMFRQEWVNCHCSCGLLWEEHPKHTATVDMKNHCMDCGDGFENTERNYESNGNYCEYCSAKHDANSKIAIRDRTYPQDDPLKELGRVLHYE